MQKKNSMTYWYGKILCAFFGALIAGPLGAVIGIIIGHSFDMGLHSFYKSNISNEELNIIQQSYFNTTFLVMGFIAKSDGHVSKNEIHVARRIMKNMQLDESMTREAIGLFYQGKNAKFNLSQSIQELKDHCQKHIALLRMFIDLQIQAATADGEMSENARTILNKICRQLGFDINEFHSYRNQYSHHHRKYNHREKQNRYSYSNNHNSDQLQQAYETLNVTRLTPFAEIKKNYRKLMSQHHPDKLIAKGLPEEMLKIATEKAQTIQAAYNLIEKNHKK